jgi:RHS repeat-associated protein
MDERGLAAGSHQGQPLRLRQRLPAWISEDASLPDEVTRYVDGLDGNLAIQTGKSGARLLQLIDMHGDVMTTLPIRDGEQTADWAALRHQTSDEFGNPTDLTTGGRKASTGASPGKNGRYGWLGGKQRSADALAGVILMGVRLYDPATGRFWSIDPEPGGNATAYDYCSGDPVNCTDLDGRWSFKSLLKKVAKVAEVVSNIPGPIGAAAAAVSAGAYAATGNRGKAIEMGISAAAAMLPGGRAAVKAGSMAIRAAGSVARRAGRAAVQAVKRCNSFTPETGVLMADGTTKAIQDVEVGELVAARAPMTGELSAQPVLNVIVGVGDKHLVTVATMAAWDATLASAEPAALAEPDSWTATANHPVWVQGLGWTDAEDLQVGDLTVGATGSRRVITALVDRGWRAAQKVYNLSVANIHTFVVGRTGDGTLVHNASCAQGGVYRLVSTDTGRTLRTGMTNNLARRQAEHGRVYSPNVEFRVLHYSNSRTVRRGLEQMAHDRYRPSLNRVNPISRFNPRRTTYMNAARAFLRGAR